MSDRVHHLKTHPRYWRDIADGLKHFEVRRDDRGFREGDILVLHEWAREAPEGERCMCTSSKCNRPTNRVERTVEYVLPGGQFGVEEGYVVLGLSRNAPVR